MTPEQVREVVKITLDELALKNMLSDPYPIILKEVEKELQSYFKNKSKKVLPALRQLSDDKYIDIIYFQYRDSKTLEWIAEYLDVSVRAVKYNKKRLITAIYNYLREC